MKLRGVDLGHVLNASGARGFSGEGYWFHALARPFGLRYEGSTLVAKTATLEPRAGNMSLDEGGRPRSLFPDCIVVKPFDGVVLNAVGLSGPGVRALAASWAARPPASPFVASVMCLEKDPGRRLAEARALFQALMPVVDACCGQLAVQVNFSCPNVGLDARHLAEEVGDVLGEAGALAALGVPILAKLSAVVPVEAARAVADHPSCDALVVSNTVPWMQLEDRIDWRRIFGSDVSPLARYGGGGLSGKPILPIVVDWLRAARGAGIDKPIVGCGGVLSKGDAGQMIDAGASAIELGSASILRPWRVQSIVRYVNERLGGQQAAMT